MKRFPFLESGRRLGILQEGILVFRNEDETSSDNILYLSDLLNNRTDIGLIDVGLSQSAIPGILLFIRLVPFKSIFMTSGISFIFRPDLENTLLRQHKKFSKRVDVIRDPAERFHFFFKENEVHGMDVRYE